MERRLYRELWKLRFEKMMELEKKSIGEYQELLVECKSQNRDHAILPHLERLITDEQKHVLLVEELLEILGRQSDGSTA